MPTTNQMNPFLDEIDGESFEDSGFEHETPDSSFKHPLYISRLPD